MSDPQLEIRGNKRVGSGVFEHTDFPYWQRKVSELPEGGIQALIQQQDENLQILKEQAFTPLLSSIGGLVAFSFLVLQDFISLGPVDLAVVISLVALASAVPLLAASFWRVRIWHSTPLPPRRTQEVTARDGTKFVRFEETALRFYTQLWIVPLAASITFVGIAAALWHAFWGASVGFILAVILGFFVVLRAWDRMIFPRDEQQKR